MAEYYLKNVKTNEVAPYTKEELSCKFGLDLKHTLYQFGIDLYIEYGIEFQQEEIEDIFFENFVENWNKYKDRFFLNDYKATSSTNILSDKGNNIENSKILEKEKKRNQKNKSAGNGEGSLYYSETLQKWIYQYWYNGKRKTLTQLKKEKKSDFLKRVNQIKIEIDTQTYIERSSETVISIAEHFIETKHSDGITSDRSYTRELETLGAIKKTCSNFCNLPIQKVTLKHIEEAKKEIKKYANNCIDKIWAMLIKIFKIACSPSVRILSFNIMTDENLKKPLSIKINKKVKSLNKTEVDRLNEILDNQEKEHKYRNIVKMQLISGMRIGEVLARSIDDFDKETGKFNVHNTVTEDKSYKTILGEHTKTYNKKTGIDEGQRYLPLFTELFSGMVEIIENQKEKKISNIHKLLFWDYENNTFISPREVNSWIRRLNEKYNICKEPLTTHRLRHTALSHWKEIGIDLRVIQYLAGHVEGSEVTDKVYIDISDDFILSEISKIV